MTEHKIKHHKIPKAEKATSMTTLSILMGLLQIVPAASTASKNYYLSHIILLSVQAPRFFFVKAPLS